jgi:hypothetical protein
MVGKQRMGQFLREAAEAELARREAGDKPRPAKPTKVRKTPKT